MKMNRPLLMITHKCMRISAISSAPLLIPIVQADLNLTFHINITFINAKRTS